MESVVIVGGVDNVENSAKQQSKAYIWGLQDQQPFI
jgi:hypothetical protein